MDFNQTIFRMRTGLEDVRDGVRAITRNFPDPYWRECDEAHPVLKERTTSEWLRVFDQLNIPCAAHNTLDSLIDDPYLNAFDFFKVIEHPTRPSIRTTVIP